MCECEVQVKRTALPLRFPKAAWSRMAGDAARWGWAYCLAAVSPEGEVALLDPAAPRPFSARSYGIATSAGFAAGAAQAAIISVARNATHRVPALGI
jgi:hypothetical protein